VLVLKKVMRFILKSIGVLLVLILLLGIVAFFAIRSSSFQTWAAQKASNYLSKELGTTVSIGKVEIDFFNSVLLKDALVKDLHNDTLLSGGSIETRIRNFDYKNQSFQLQEVRLKNTTVKLQKHKTDTVFNYQFLADYFAGGKKSTTPQKPWNIAYGDLIFDDVNFVYRNAHKDTSVTSNINYNAIYAQHIYGKINEYKQDKDTFYATITDFKLKEQCGFVVNQLNARVKISEQVLQCSDLLINTPQTYINGNLKFEYKTWDDYSDFITNVKMKAEFTDSTHVNAKDIATFAPELNGLNETVFIKGKVNGYVNDLNLTNTSLRYRAFTEFTGDLSISGLPDMDNCYLHFKTQRLSTNYKDLIQVPNYPFTKNTRLQIPSKLAVLGTVAYKGTFDGLLNDFTTYGNFSTALGNIGSDLSIQLGKTAADIQYHGKIKTRNFNIGALAGMKDLGALSLDTKLKGKGLSLKDLDTEIEGKVQALNYKGYTYKNMILNGSIQNKIFNGLFESQDPNAQFDFNGNVDFTNKIPKLDFISTINGINPRALKLVTAGDTGILSSQVLINLKGDDINNLSGEINFDDTQYKTSKKTYKLSTFDLQLDQSTPTKKIKLNSAYLNALVEGKFNPNTIDAAFNHFLSAYYPTFIKKQNPKMVYTDAFDFKVNIKKFNTINELFLPDVMLSPGTQLIGNFSAPLNTLNVAMYSDTIVYKGIRFNKVQLQSKEENDVITAKLEGQRIGLTDSLGFTNFNLCLSSRDRNTKYNFEWNNKKNLDNYSGELAGQVVFNNSNIYLTYDTAFAVLKDTTWSLMRSNPSVIDTNGNVILNPLVFKNDNQLINLQGKLSSNPTDVISINTQNFRLEQLNPFLSVYHLKLNGVLNGNINLYNTLKNIAFSSDLNLSRLKINENLIGQLVVKNNYNSEQKQLELDGYTTLGFKDENDNPVKNLAFKGFYYMDKKEESLNIDISATPLNLRLLNPILKDILTINRGMISGNGNLHGTPDKPLIEGKFNLFKSDIKVDYTNVNYEITGPITIYPDQISFEELKMKELNSKAVPQGTISGNIFHTNFTRIQIDYDINYRNMLVLNTTEKENKDFYGKVYGSGNIGLYGFLNDIHMRVVDTTMRNTKFFLPLDGPAEVGENNFIRFVKRDTIKQSLEEKLSGFSLDMDIEATPDAQMQIIFDKKTGDVLNAQGYGNLKMNINTLGKFDFFGDYTITDGDYLFTLENVISKKFDIDAGSSIKWSGSPYNADIDIIASYKQRTSIAPLMPPGDPTVSAKRRVPVDCKLKMGDRLLTPKITFAIDLLSLDDNTKSKINSVLQDEVELNRQVFSLLLFKSFVPPEIYNRSGGVTAGGAASASGADILNSTVSNLLSGLTDQVQIGFNYRPGNQLNNDEVDLALSKQLFDERLIIDGNIGVNNSQARNSNNLIGDVNVEYKLTQDGKFRVKGFNRSNDNTQITTAGGTFTQGVGLFYREEFETFKQLYKRYLEKLKPTK
jgi:hypothetical protein